MASIDRYTGCLAGLALGDAMANNTPDFAEAPLTTEEWSISDRTRQTRTVAEAALQLPTDLLDERGLLLEAARTISHWYHEDGVGQGNPEKPVLEAARALLGGADPRAVFDADSQGADALLRALPLGLLYPPQRAADAARALLPLTHGHPDALASGAALAWLVSKVARGAALEPSLIEQAPNADDQVRTRLQQALRPPSGDPGHAGRVLAEAIALVLAAPVPSWEAWEQTVADAGRVPGDGGRTGALVGALLGLSWGIGAVSRHLLEALPDTATHINLGRALHLKAYGLEAGDGPLEVDTAGGYDSSRRRAAHTALPTDIEEDIVVEDDGL